MLMYEILLFYFILIIIICTSINSTLNIELENVVQTYGSAGVEYFSLGNNNHYFVCANFWDGIDNRMGAKNTVHKILESSHNHQSKLIFPIIQELHGTQFSIYFCI